MLLLIYKNHHTTVVEISDCTYDAISKGFELIGHPEYTINPIDIKSFKVDTEYTLYDWDDIATGMTEQNKSSMSEVDLDLISDIGSIEVISDKFVEINQE